MTDRAATLARIETGGVVAVLRGVTSENLDAIATAVADGGITAVEVTADTDGAVGKIEQLRAALTGRETVVGVGTVLDAATARAALMAGAEFVVTPTLTPEVVETANRAGVLVMPGIMTPTEAQRALEAGTDVVKMFPAKTVGPDHLGAIHGPLSQVDIVPTGGVTLDNAGEFIEAGAIAVGAGSSLVTEDILETEDWNALEERAAALVESVESAR